MKVTKEIKAGFLADLRASLAPGDTLHCIIRNVTASGMSRSIDVYRFRCVDGKIEKQQLSWRVAVVAGESWDNKRECIRVGGCGMDIVHAIVYNLGRVLWPQGFGVLGTASGGHRTRPADRDMAAGLVADGYWFRGRNGDQSGWDNAAANALDREARMAKPRPSRWRTTQRAGPRLCFYGSDY